MKPEHEFLYSAVESTLIILRGFVFESQIK